MSEDIERKFKKTINEIRAEDGLPPLPGMDDFIAGPEYATWYGQFSKKAEDQAALAQQQQTDALAAQQGQEGGPQGSEDDGGFDLESNLIKPEQAEVPGEPKPKMTKSRPIRRLPRRVKVEYYKLSK